MLFCASLSDAALRLQFVKTNCPCHMKAQIHADKGGLGAVRRRIIRSKWLLLIMFTAATRAI